MYKIAKENLSALFQSIAENQELYLPVEVSGQVNYKAWTPDAKVSLETLKTVKSPKDAFFPQSENLYTVQRDGKKLSIQPEALKEQNFVVFGMKACDIQGVKVILSTASTLQEENTEPSLPWHVMSRKNPASVKYSASTVQNLQQM